MHPNVALRILVTQADRAGRADQFGDLYDASQLKAANLADLGVAAQEGSARALQRTATARDCTRKAFRLGENGRPILRPA